LAGAAERYDESLELYRSLGDRYGVALSELYLGMVEVERERHDEATGHLARALPVFREMGFLQYSSQCLELIAELLRARGDAQEAARLLAGANAIRDRTGQSGTAWARRPEREIAMVRTALGDERFEAAWAEGRSLRDDELFARAERAVAG
jgi:tetratricopeptide (TPR) repeat protein